MADEAKQVIRWSALGLAVATVAVFLAAQRQSTDVSYGSSPSGSVQIEEGSAGELSDAGVPSVEEMTAQVAASDRVRLPGTIAYWDEQRVTAAAGSTGVRILAAPPGLDEEERDRVRAVENATVRVLGTEVTGGIYQASPSTLTEWRATFTTGDVTEQLVALIAGLQKKDAPAGVDGLQRRDPTAAETAPILTALRAGQFYRADGTTATELPAATATAFPGGTAKVVVLPRQPYGKPVPRFGPALAAAFPQTPIVVVYGDWIEYDGPQAADFAEITSAGFYSRFGDRLSLYAYPQQTILSVWLNRVTDVRYAGLFDRPLPYQPFDPLRVALPALPWVFAACVLTFLLLSLRSIRRPRELPPAGTPARLAGLTALAVEMSALTDRTSEAALTRGITQLTAAREALQRRLDDEHVTELLTRAEAELDEAGAQLPYPGYRPAEYLSGRLS